MSNKGSGVFIGGLMLGTAIGTLTGLLIAPRKGRETRKLLQKSANAIPEVAEDLSTSLHIQADRIYHHTRLNLGETIERLQLAIAAGVDASQREKQTLKQENNLENVDSLTQP
ncbi:YtxH domain-containing protein [Calothrix rhizosoleniae]|uniref:YtxH domain-containing protein n=1 Tax=Calothrix rhizosoleniae TaxID=888997 RepID=UPI000B4A1CF5|nr:YtxH domain-containing protein [Calothrix rhizosoleniae]